MIQLLLDRIQEKEPITYLMEKPHHCALALSLSQGLQEARKSPAESQLELIAKGPHKLYLILTVHLIPFAISSGQ